MNNDLLNTYIDMLNEDLDNFISDGFPLHFQSVVDYWLIKQLAKIMVNQDKIIKILRDNGKITDYE